MIVSTGYLGQMNLNLIQHSFLAVILLYLRDIQLLGIVHLNILVNSSLM